MADKVIIVPYDPAWPVLYRLAEQHQGDRVGYTEAKSPFIWTIMVKADQWSQESGWQPGPSDA
jgi:GrpB-like predicted nucleotidyltransferase (UPF0157 family)